MKKINFDIYINADKEKVWETITSIKTYNEWTSVFSPSSFYEGGWNTGDKIKFLGYDEKGEKGGMTAEIAISHKPDFVSIRHLGYILNSIEDTTSEAIKKWAPAYENYTIIEEAGKTKLIIYQEIEEQYEQMFLEMWPKALQKIKEISEK